MKTVAMMAAVQLPFTARMHESRFVPGTAQMDSIICEVWMCIMWRTSNDRLAKNSPSRDCGWLGIAW